MASLTGSLALAGLLVLGLITALWLLSLVLRDASIADIFWGLGLVALAWTYFVLTPDGFAPRKLIIAGLTTIWGLRLATHLLRRNVGHGEDFRYRQWRAAAGRRWWWRSFFTVFLLQGAIMLAVSVPLLAGQQPPLPARLIWLDFVGMAIWAVGFYFEAAGDLQLARFRADPNNRGQLLRTGVWRYTRHPNYFGDAAVWWGLFFIAAAAGGWWTVFSPLLLTFLLLRVSGVALLERTLVNSKPGYAQYVRSTSAFVPWFPKASPQVKGNSDD